MGVRIPEAGDLRLVRSLIESAFAHAPVGLGLWDRELRYIQVNETLARMNGLPIDAHLGKRVEEVLPNLDKELVEGLQRALEGEQPVLDLEVGGETPAAPGERRRWKLSFYPVPDGHGRAAAVGAVVTEVGPGKHEEVRELQVELGRERRLRSAFERELVVEQEIATTLERSLLPIELPKLPRLALEGRYRPTGSRHRVGGDFYDAFEVDEGLMIVLGDVAGKGADAAAVTSRARDSLRALALYEQRPARLLEQLNVTFIAKPGGPRLLTAVVALIAPVRRPRRATIACAGHPRPFLIRRRRQVREVGRSNPAIGLARRPTFREKTVRLRKGDRLFFYTDGLTDAGAPARLLSSDDLRGALSGRETLPLGSLVDNVISWACPPASRDDIAVVATECR